MYEALHCTNDILNYMILIDGKKAAAELREELKKEVSDLKEKYNKVPGLTVILIGDLTPSQIYVRNKEKSANEVGLKSDVIKYPDTVEEKVILKKIDELNGNSKTSKDKDDNKLEIESKPTPAPSPAPTPAPSPVPSPAPTPAPKPTRALNDPRYKNE